MQDLSLINSPLLNFGLIIAALIFLQSMGFDIRSMFRRYFGTDGKPPSDESLANLRSDFQQLLMGQETLSTHFNHETSESQARLEAGVAALARTMEDHVRQHDRTNYLLEDIKTNGIKCRKE